MRNKSFYVDNEIYDLTSLWILNVIFRAGGKREFLRSKSDNIFEFLGVNSNEPRQQDIKRLMDKLAILKKSKISCGLKDLEHNLNLLRSNLGLNDTEKDILRFTALMHDYEIISDACDLIGNLNDRQSDI